MEQTKICQQCHKNLPLLHFKKKDKYTSRCITCLDKRIIPKTKCEFLGCGLVPSFNFERERVAKFCSKHKEIGMVNIKHSKCIICKKKRPYFNFKGESKATHCKDCSEEGMTDIKNAKCIICKKKIPCFNFEGESKATHCKDCCEEGMINIKSPKCIVCKKKRPYFNFKGESKATHCKDCSEEGMTDIKNAKCVICKNKIPCFNFEGESKRTHCKDCCEEGMIDIVSSKCIVCKNKNPVFNFKGYKATHCKDCSEEGMINTKDKKCVVCNKKQPCFNFEDEKKATHCKDCSEGGMIDVKKIKCDYTNCMTRASYGISGNKSSRCSKHKLEGMISHPKRKCEIENCKEIALFGISKHIHCEKHKEDDEVNFIEKKCISCNLLCILNKDNKCYHCSDFKNVKSRLEKQKRILNILEPLYKVSYYDKVIDSKCNLKRPDIVIDCNSFFLILEIDENQHNGYKKECEEPRMNMVTQALGMPTFWIRYNPDDYKDETGKKSKISKAQREELLLKWIEKCCKIQPLNEKEFVRVCFLFYDGFNKDSEFNYNIVSGLV